MIKSQIEDFDKDIVVVERIVKTNRHVMVDIERDEISFKDELDVLQLESLSSSKALEDILSKEELTKENLHRTMKQMDALVLKCSSIRVKLNTETKTISSQEKRTQIVQSHLEEMEKEEMQIKKEMSFFKEQMFKLSQRLAGLRMKEMKIIKETESVKVFIYNFRYTLELMNILSSSPSIFHYLVGNRNKSAIQVYKSPRRAIQAG